MKVLLVLVVILGAVMLWRNRQAHNTPKVPPKTPAQPLDMVRCAQCGMHLPDNEAIQGRNGTYCSQEHLLQSEP